MIRDQIALGRLRPGERIRQAELASELHVGVSTVREALMRLESEGFLETEAYKGFRVAIPTPDYQRDLGEILSALEQLAAGLAAARIAPDELARMEDLLPQTIWGDTPDVSAVKQADREFHTIIFEASRRSELFQMFLRVWDKYHASNMVHYSHEDWQKQSELSRIHHQSILQALKTGDADGARRAVARLWEEDIQHDERIFARLFKRDNNSE